MLSFISTQKQLNLCSRHWMQSLIICNLPAVQLCFTNSLFFYNYIVSILREEKTIEEQPPGNHIHFIPFILIQSLGSTPAGKIMFGKNCSILCKFFGWIFSKLLLTTPNIKSVNTYLLLRLPEKWTSFSLSPLPLILLFLIISILFSAELSSHLKVLFDLLSEQYKMWNQDSRSLFSSNSSTALIVHRRLSSPS